MSESTTLEDENNRLIRKLNEYADANSKHLSDLAMKTSRIEELEQENNDQAAKIEGMQDVQKGLERALEKRHEKQRKVAKENKELHLRLKAQRWKTDHANYCLQRMVEIGHHLWETQE